MKKKLKLESIVSDLSAGIKFSYLYNTIWYRNFFRAEECSVLLRMCVCRDEESLFEVFVRLSMEFSDSSALVHERR